MKQIKQGKTLIVALSLLVALFVWAELGAFKLFRNQSGEKWSPREHSGSIHHK